MILFVAEIALDLNLSQLQAVNQANEYDENVESAYIDSITKIDVIDPYDDEIIRASVTIKLRTFNGHGIRFFGQERGKNNIGINDGIKNQVRRLLSARMAEISALINF